MSDLRPDADLRQRFQQLRSEEREAAPDFGAMLAEVRAALESGAAAAVADRGEAASVRLRGRRRWLWAGSSVAAAAAVAALVLFNPDVRADRQFEAAVRAYASVAGGWRTPTDALLEIPGSEMTRSVPRLGTTDWPGGAGDASRRDRTRGG